MELSIIDKKLAMDSRDIAKLTHKSHSHVIRDIKNMIQKLNVSKNGSSYNIKSYKNEMAAKELKAIRASEAMASLLLDDEYGYSEVNPVCVEACNVVKNALQKRIAG